MTELKTVRWQGQSVTLYAEQELRVMYRNHEGRRGWRRVIPLPVAPFWGSTPYHAEQQWLLRVWDLDKDAERTYAMKDIDMIRSVGEEPTAG
jgi:hypothetical protein